MIKNNTSLFLNFFFYLIILLLSLGQIGRISFFNAQAHFYLHELFIFIFCIFGIIFIFFNHPSRKSPIVRSSWMDSVFRFGGISAPDEAHIQNPRSLGRESFKKERPIKINVLLKWWLIFITWLFISLIIKSNEYSVFQNLIGLFYIVRMLLYTLFGYISYSLIRAKYLNANIIRNSLYLFFGITLITSIIQYFWYPNLRNLYYLGWDPHWYRVFGLFFDTTVMALILGTIVLYLINRLIIHKDKKYKYLYIISLIISIALFLLTYSRIGYLVVGISLSFLFLRLHKYSLFFIFLSVGVLSVYSLPRPQGESVHLERTFSIESRFKDIKEGIILWKENPIIGVGYNRIRFHKNYLGNPNSASGYSSTYITILASSGIIGLILLILTVIKACIFYWKNIFMFSFLLSVIISGLFDNVIFQTHTLSLIVLIIISNMFLEPGCD